MKDVRDIICPECKGMLEDKIHKKDKHSWRNLYCNRCEIEWRI